MYLIKSKTEDLNENNAHAKEHLESLTESKVSAFHADLDEKWAEVKGWFDDRLEWAEQLEQSYYKDHLIKELNSKFDTNEEIINEHRAMATTLAEEANDMIWTYLSNQLDRFVGKSNMEVESLRTSINNAKQ